MKLAAALFVQISEKHGMGAKVGAAGALTADRISRLSAEGARLVCLSYFDADLSTAEPLRGSAFAPASRGDQDSAGFWQSGPGQASEHCAATKADFYATRFKEALAFCLHEAVKEEKGGPRNINAKPAV